MKINAIKFFIIFFLPVFLSSGLYAKAPIAVIANQYDDVAKVLQNLKIDYDVLEFRDLEKKDIFERYPVIFIPCGIEEPETSTINVMAQGSSIKSVALKADYYEIDNDKIAKNIKKYIKNGGFMYVSGYSFKYLQLAFDVFDYFDSFPYIGLPGRVEAKTKVDLRDFSMNDMAALYMTHEGWISIKSARNAVVLSEATYETPRGFRTGPISMMFHLGEGLVLYTSYHSSVYSDFRRFNIYRIAGAPLIKTLEDTAAQWDQSIGTELSDAILRDEYYRMYRLKTAEGLNSLYFTSKEGFYQIDIFDSNMRLIESRDPVRSSETFNFKAHKGGYCYVKIYPSTSDRFPIYAFISAHGSKPFPYWYRFVLACIACATFVCGACIYRFFNIKYGFKKK